MTQDEINTVRRELKHLEYARREFDMLRLALNTMGFHEAADKLKMATLQMALAEGEIEQAVFGTRGVS